MSFQDYDLVKQLMDEMRAIFDDYLKVIEAMNEDIEDNINNGSASALYSNIVGKPFKEQWEALYTDFKGLELFFSDTYGKIGATTVNNAELEEYAAGLFGSDAKANSSTSSHDTILNGSNNGGTGASLNGDAGVGMNRASKNVTVTAK